LQATASKLNKGTGIWHEIGIFHFEGSGEAAAVGMWLLQIRALMKIFTAHVKMAQ